MRVRIALLGVLIAAFTLLLGVDPAAAGDINPWGP